MKLVIREYLSMLKESGELDVLLPDLLLMMGLNPLSKPGIGQRQFGVDLAAMGVDPEDGQRKLFLVAIKRGDITRNIWDTGKQSVRQTLNEIRDSYLRTRVRPKHEELPKKIILATGGRLKQDVEPDWINYIHNNKGFHRKYGEIDYDFWGGDKLAVLIERYFLDEYLFPESAQKQMRKTIVLADQNEEEPRYFYELIEETLFKRDLPKQKTASARRERQRTLRLLNLCLNIVFHWCKDAENLRPALFCAERTVLLTWDWMRQSELFDCRTTQRGFARLFQTYLMITGEYATKLKPHCFVRDGLFGYGADELEYPLRTFEVIGIFGVLCIALWNLAVDTKDKQERESLSKKMKVVAQTLVALIENNPPSSTPRYDEHAIDIALGLLALNAAGFIKQATKWIEELSARIIFAYRLGQSFPVSSDAYDDLVAMEVSQALPKDHLMALSTLLPMVAHWYAILDLADSYNAFQKAVTETFEKTDFQLWYPDENTDDYLYSTNAGRASGVVFSSIQLPETLDRLKAKIISLSKEQKSFNTLSCVEQGWSVLGLIASRHFRTPVMPEYWQKLVSAPSVQE